MTNTQPDYFDNARPPQDRQAREAQQALDNKRLGILIFQISWMMAFFALVIVNWQLRFQYESWPPPNVQAMGVWLPTVATGLLLAGVVFARMARRAVMRDDAATMTARLVVTLATGLLFVGIMAYEWWRVGQVDVANTQYQSVFRLMTGFHMLHAVVIGILIASVVHNALYARRQPAAPDAIHYNSQHFWMVEAVSKLWDFVFVAWVLFYVVLYWWRSA